MVLWARWLADGNPVPPGHPRQGRARPGFRDEDARAAPTDSDVRQRSAVRHAGWDAEPIEEYLGSPILAQLRRLFVRPVRVLGYNRQRIRGNWKLYAENTRDNYHASLLHEFLVTFGLDRSTQVGG